MSLRPNSSNIAFPMASLTPPPKIENQKRRTLLLAGLSGVGAFFASKLLGQVTFSERSEIVRSATFENFTFVETDDEMTVSERGGDVIVVIDKTSFRE